MQWVNKKSSLPKRGERVLFGYIVSTGGNRWKEYKVSVFDRIEGFYVINDLGRIICTTKQLKCWCYIDEFPKSWR